MERPTIVVIGSGNVATHLAKALDEIADVIEVYSKHAEHAEALAVCLRDCHTVSDIGKINKNADYYLISVNDDAIKQIATELECVNGIIMHTSGSVSIDALGKNKSQRGVFYPLQTFSKNVPVDINDVPMFIEASDCETLRHIESLAKAISGKVYKANSEQRTVLHIAAVFACNFGNHLLDLSSQILQTEGYSLDVLKPLLDVTIDKAMRIGPHSAQTGPAVRNDHNVINKHLNILEKDKSEVYRVLTESIINNFRKQK